MSTLNLLAFILLFNSVWCVNFDYFYQYEAFLTYGGDPCLGNCINGRCIKNWNGDYGACTATNVIAPQYNGLNGPCFSNCGKFGETYEWCVWDRDGKELTWDLCSQKQATTGREVVKADTYFSCLDECGFRNFKAPWCYTSEEWKYCDPENKIILFNYPTAYGDECETPCVHFEYYNGCYNRKHEWVKCYLNPKKDRLLTRINKIIMSKIGPGLFTHSGYGTCSPREPTNYDWPVIASTRDLISYYEREFPSMVPPETSIQSVTMIPINIGTDYFILPLALRARIGANDLLPMGTRDITNTRVNNNFEKMNPIDDRQTGVSDEYGHMLARMLGGTAEPYNFFPMLKRLNFPEGTQLYALELYIVNFLKNDPGRYADYQAALTYSGEATIRFRPTAMLVSVRLYEANGTLVTDNPFNDDMYFSNNPNLNCTESNLVYEFDVRSRSDENVV